VLFFTWARPTTVGVANPRSQSPALTAPEPDVRGCRVGRLLRLPVAGLCQPMWKVPICASPSDLYRGASHPWGYFLSRSVCRRTASAGLVGWSGWSGLNTSRSMLRP